MVAAARRHSEQREESLYLPVTSMVLRAEIQGSFTPFRMTSWRIHRKQQEPCRSRALATSMFYINSLGGGDGVDRDETPVLTAVLEADHAVDLGEQGIVLAAADVQAGLERGSALANQNGAAGDRLAGEALHAEALRVGVATVF